MMIKNGEGMRFTIVIPFEKHKQLKYLCALNGRTMKEIVMQSIDIQIQKLESLLGVKDK